jgi:4-diphosphocytidyl-2-C-methyl-D-erythritol kinase
VADLSLKVLAPAKINWNLRVLHRRGDGFHEIESLVTAVTLYDEIEFMPGHDSDRAVSCDDPAVPCDQSNLILRAAALLARASGCDFGCACRLSKRIPVGGGLGGGSSNGAAALLALNRLWKLNWPIESLSPLAAELGSDVSFFLHGGSAVIGGRGERVRPVQLGWQGWIALLMPDFGVSTPAVYRAWRPAPAPAGPIEGDRSAGAVEWMRASFNMLEEPAMRVCPELGALWEHANRLTDRPVRVSGSGSTLYTAFQTRNEAERFAETAASALGLRTAVVRPAQHT